MKNVITHKKENVKIINIEQTKRINQHKNRHTKDIDKDRTTLILRKYKRTLKGVLNSKRGIWDATDIFSTFLLFIIVKMSFNISGQPSICPILRLSLFVVYNERTSCKLGLNFFALRKLVVAVRLQFFNGWEGVWG